jgi:hypothetical protein
LQHHGEDRLLLRLHRDIEGEGTPLLDDERSIGFIDAHINPSSGPDLRRWGHKCRTAPQGLGSVSKRPGIFLDGLGDKVLVRLQGGSGILKRGGVLLDGLQDNVLVPSQRRRSVFEEPTILLDGLENDVLVPLRAATLSYSVLRETPSLSGMQWLSFLPPSVSYSQPRSVTKEHTQIEGVGFNELFAVVVNRYEFHLALHFSSRSPRSGVGPSPYQTALLNGNLEETAVSYEPARDA